MANPDDAWLVEAICHFVDSPAWNSQLTEFITSKCEEFDNFEEEFKHEYTEVHMEYKDLVDNLLAAQLMELGVEPEEFEQRIFQAGLMDDPRLQKVVDLLLAAEDFVRFKNMMVGYHTSMQQQREQTYNEVAQAEDLAHAMALEEAQRELDQEAASEAIAAASLPAGPPAVPQAAFVSQPPTTSVGPSFVGPVPSAPSLPAASRRAPTAAEETRFAAEGGSYGRASFGTSSRKPGSNEKSAAIRRAILGAVRPS